MASHTFVVRCEEGLLSVSLLPGAVGAQGPELGVGAAGSRHKALSQMFSPRSAMP